MEKGRVLVKKKNYLTKGDIMLIRVEERKYYTSILFLKQKMILEILNRVQKDKIYSARIQSDDKAFGISHDL